MAYSYPARGIFLTALALLSGALVFLVFLVFGSLAFLPLVFLVFFLIALTGRPGRVFRLFAGLSPAFSLRKPRTIAVR